MNKEMIKNEVLEIDKKQKTEKPTVQQMRILAGSSVKDDILRKI